MPRLNTHRWGSRVDFSGLLPKSERKATSKKSCLILGAKSTQKISFLTWLQTKRYFGRLGNKFFWLKDWWGISTWFRVQNPSVS